MVLTELLIYTERYDELVGRTSYLNTDLKHPESDRKIGIFS